MLTKKEKFTFFITAYTPVWIIFLLKIWFLENKEENEIFLKKLLKYDFIFSNLLTLKNIIIFILIVQILWSFYNLLIILNPKTSKSTPLKIVRVKNISIDYITNYFSLYLFPFFTLEVINILNIIIFLFILIIASYIYVKNNIVYINPILNLLGYSIYEIEINTNDGTRIENAYFITKRERYNIDGEISNIYKFEKNIFFEKN